MSAYPPFEDLVPHAGPMVLLDELVQWEPGRARCRLTLREDAPFVRGGRVDAVVTLEYMAQAVAACLGHEAYLGGEGVRVGMIIGCRKMDLHQPAIPVGAEVLVDAERTRGHDTLSHFQCGVTVDGAPVASASLTLYHAEEPPQ